MISFAHNVQNRHKTLRETIEMERRFFPDSPIYVAYNDSSFNIGYFDDIKNIKFIQYKGDGHKIGCVNGCIVSIQAALKNKNKIIVFSHDDVKINPSYIKVFNRNIEKITNGKYDIICRNPDSYGKNYYMMEAFFINKKIATNLFKNRTLYQKDCDLPLDLRRSPSPEVWLHDVFNEDKHKIQHIKYVHTNNSYNKTLAENLGFLHKNAGLRGWKD